MSYLQSLLHSPRGWAILLGIVLMILMTNACHEGGHALAAWWSGDRRAAIRRRTTLDPRVHFHWLLTLVLPLVSLMLFGWLIGGARPVLVDAGRIGPRRMALVALAGPAGNFLFAGFVIALMGFSMAAEWVDPINPIDSLAWRILKPAVWFSVVLGVLNLIPIPPLDGSRVVAVFMPEKVRRIWYLLAPVGIMGVLFLLLWFSGQLVAWGLGEGHPEIFQRIEARMESYLFEMMEFWRAVL